MASRGPTSGALLFQRAVCSCPGRACKVRLCATWLAHEAGRALQASRGKPIDLNQIPSAALSPRDRVFESVVSQGQSGDEGSSAVRELQLSAPEFKALATSKTQGWET